MHGVNILQWYKNYWSVKMFEKKAYCLYLICFFETKWYKSYWSGKESMLFVFDVLFLWDNTFWISFFVLCRFGGGLAYVYNGLIMGVFLVTWQQRAVGPHHLHHEEAIWHTQVGHRVIPWLLKASAVQAFQEVRGPVEKQALIG